MINWRLHFALAAGVLIVTLILWLLFSFVRHKKKRASPFYFFFAGVILSALILLLPFKAAGTEEGANHPVNTVVLALHHTFQMFSLDAATDLLAETAEGLKTAAPGLEGALQIRYMRLLAVEFILAPLMTFGFVASFFRNLSGAFRYRLRYFNTAYVFSDLNEKSIALAESVKHNHRLATIVFTNVSDKDDDTPDDLVVRAQNLRAICYKRSILEASFRWHWNGRKWPFHTRKHLETTGVGRKDKLIFFAIEEDETRNIARAVNLIRRYNGKAGTALYVFSSKTESELLLNQCDGGLMRIHRVNAIRSLIYSLLYEKADRLFSLAFDHRQENEDLIPVSVAIVGMGQHGTEMLKALSWYGQMPGFRVEINAYDVDPMAEKRFAAQCPDLMNDKYNGHPEDGEAAYTIRIHGDTDVESKDFLDEMRKLRERDSLCYVFVALGSDEKNIRTAAVLRSLFAGIGNTDNDPVIETVIYRFGGKDMSGVRIGGDMTNFKGQPYNIGVVGTLEKMYSEDSIIHSDLEKRALGVHCRWGDEESFWKYEYNYRSSCATAIHMRALVEHLAAVGLKPEDIDREAARELLKKLEHCRWNAYMRSEGYTYNEKRFDLAKHHHDLVNFYALPEKTRNKDDNTEEIKDRLARRLAETAKAGEEADAGRKGDLGELRRYYMELPAGDGQLT